MLDLSGTETINKQVALIWQPNHAEKPHGQLDQFCLDGPRQPDTLLQGAQSSKHWQTCKTSLQTAGEMETTHRTIVGFLWDEDHYEDGRCNSEIAMGCQRGGRRSNLLSMNWSRSRKNTGPRPKRNASLSVTDLLCWLWTSHLTSLDLTSLISTVVAPAAKLKVPILKYERLLWLDSEQDPGQQQAAGMPFCPSALWIHAGRSPCGPVQGERKVLGRTREFWCFEISFWTDGIRSQTETRSEEALTLRFLASSISTWIDGMSNRND